MTKKVRTIIKNKKDSLSKGASKTGHLCIENYIKISHTIYKNKHSWLKDLNVRLETIKIIEDN